MTNRNQNKVSISKSNKLYKLLKENSLKKITKRSELSDQPLLEYVSVVEYHLDGSMDIIFKDDTDPTIQSSIKEFLESKFDLI